MSAESIVLGSGAGPRERDTTGGSPCVARFARQIELPCSILAIVSIPVTSGRTESHPSGLDARQASPACEVILAQQVAVKGLNPAWESCIRSRAPSSRA